MEGQRIYFGGVRLWVVWLLTNLRSKSQLLWAIHSYSLQEEAQLWAVWAGYWEGSLELDGFPRLQKPLIQGVCQCLAQVYRGECGQP